MQLPIPEISLGQLRAECRGAVKHNPNGIAVFDADGTIWAPDIANRIWRYVLERRALKSPGREAILAAAKKAGVEVTYDPYVDAHLLFSAYFAGRVEEELIVRVMVNGLAGLTRTEIDGLIRKALQQGTPPFVDEAHEGMADFIRELKAWGMRIAVVSGSPIWAVREGLRGLDVPADIVLAGDVLMEGDRLTATIVEPMTFREGKGKIYDERIGELPLFAFGDGESDIPLLERARILAVGVNPRPSLRKVLPKFGVRARVLNFTRTAVGRPISPPQQDESID